MPARRLGAESQPVQRFDVLGLDAANSPEFIGHVGLTADERVHAKAGSVIAMVHMGPPFATEFPHGAATCVGTSTLTTDEMLQIKLFIDNLEDEYESANVRNAFAQYCIAPHVRRYPRDGDTVICLQFNCAGFVLEAYRFANLDLLETNPRALPPVSLDVLSMQYPEFVQWLENPRLRERLGIPGDGPWPVVLAGYVVNSMSRSESQIRSAPHRAKVGDGFFPPRPLETSEPNE
jgi:hypothetical protein